MIKYICKIIPDLCTAVLLFKKVLDNIIIIYILYYIISIKSLILKYIEKEIITIVIY
jgi:hypothetical protein